MIHSLKLYNKKNHVFCRFFSDVINLFFFLFWQKKVQSNINKKEKLLLAYESSFAITQLNNTSQKAKGIFSTHADWWYNIFDFFCYETLPKSKTVNASVTARNASFRKRQNIFLSRSPQLDRVVAGSTTGHETHLSLIAQNFNQVKSSDKLKTKAKRRKMKIHLALRRLSLLRSRAIGKKGKNLIDIGSKFLVFSIIWKFIISICYRVPIFVR